jgi:hypothetical protein
MAASYDASYQEALGGSKRRRTVKALDAQGLHHSGFDVARGKSGIRHHQKLDLERHPEKAQATHRKLRAKDRPFEDDGALATASIPRSAHRVACLPDLSLAATGLPRVSLAEQGQGVLEEAFGGRRRPSPRPVGSWGVVGPSFPFGKTRRPAVGVDGGS